MNDYSSVNVSTMKKNMENNLSSHEDKDIEETKVDSTEPVSKESASKFVSALRKNGRNIVEKYSGAMSTISKPMVEKYVDDFSDTVSEAISDGSLTGVSQSDVDEFMREDVKRMVHQEVETRRRSLGDHGIRHIAGNTKSSLSMLNELQQHGVPITGKNKLMAMAIQANHDMGYTVGAAATDVKHSGEHKAQSKVLADEEKGRYDKIFGAQDSEKMRNIIATHDSPDVDWDKDPIGSSVRLADNTSLFGNEKVQDLFIRNPKTMNLACKLRLAATAKPDDKDLQKDIKRQMHEAIDDGSFDDFDKDELHRQVDEMSEGKFSTSADILSRYSGEIKGFKFNPDKKMMNVDMAYSPEGETVDALFGSDVSAKQFDKFAKDMGVQSMRGKRGKMTFKNPEGKRVFSLNIEGIDKDPIESAATGSMRDFLKKTARGELRSVSSELKKEGAGDKETEKAKKTLEKSRKKFTDKEWDELMRAIDEGKDLGALAKKLDAWPLLASEMDYLESKTASVRHIAMRVALSLMGDRVARSVFSSRSLMIHRKEKDTMRDTGGRSKVPEKEPSLKPPREDISDPWRTKDKPSKDRDPDTDKNPDRIKDKDMRVAADIATMAKQELARWPKRFVDVVMRMI